MKQFQRILRFEMRHYFTNRAFVGVTLFLAVTIAVVMFFPRILESAGSGEGEPVDRPVMLLAGDPSAVTPGLDEAFAGAFGEYEVRRFDGDAEAIKAAVTAKEGECGIYLHSLRDYTYYVNNRMLADRNAAVADEVLRQLAAQQFLIEQGLDMAAVQAAQTVAVTHEEVTLGSIRPTTTFTPTS
ncbi:MAG: hypothetical protein ACOYJY_00760 [Acutalibacteraceae bacterium]|jgi:ABC-type Na+ efflux pump permease subunit